MCGYLYLTHRPTFNAVACIQSTEFVIVSSMTVCMSNVMLLRSE